eukprot:m.83063 g.83063  ORF g.83063 m.83063 type:complete len:536 (+) comp12110_c0_seq1:45-1652(+)
MKERRGRHRVDSDNSTNDECDSDGNSSSDWSGIEEMLEREKYHTPSNEFDDRHNHSSSTHSVWKVVYLGTCFLFIFTAFQTSSFFQAGLLKDLNFGDLGLLGLGLLYGFFALFSFVAPFVVSRIGIRWTIMLGGAGYVLMLASLIEVNKIVFLIASAINGMGSAFLWTAQGAALVEFSSPGTQGRNSGIFWAILQCSLLTGSGASALMLSPTKAKISPHTAQILYIALTSVCGVGVLMLVFLKFSKKNNGEQLPFFSGIKNTLKLFLYKEMLMLLPIIFYSGQLLSFWQAQYPTIISNKNSHIPLPEEFVPFRVVYLMLIICAAEVIGCTGFGKLSDIVGRWPIVVLGVLMCTVVFVLFYLNFIRQLWVPTLTYAYIYAFILGLCDSVYNTQTYAALALAFPDESAAAFGLNFFARAIGSAVAFYYGEVLRVEYHLVILGAVLVVSSALFVVADMSLIKKARGVEYTMLVNDFDEPGDNVLPRSKNEFVVGRNFSSKNRRVLGSGSSDDTDDEFFDCNDKSHTDQNRFFGSPKLV